VSIKPKQILSGLTILWVVVVLLEGISSLFRRFYSRGMHGAARAVSGVVHSGKAVVLIALALSNIFLFMRQIDERQ